METTVSDNIKEEKLTLKILEKHIVKTILGSLAVALVGALITSFTFYYQTNSSINELNQSKEETKQDIKTLKNDVSEIKTSLSGTNIYTNLNKEEVQTLKVEIAEMKKQQEEMLRVMYEIKAKVK